MNQAGLPCLLLSAHFADKFIPLLTRNVSLCTVIDSLPSIFQLCTSTLYGRTTNWKSFTDHYQINYDLVSVQKSQTLFSSEDFTISTPVTPSKPQITLNHAYTLWKNKNNYEKIRNLKVSHKQGIALPGMDRCAIDVQ